MMKRGQTVQIKTISENLVTFDMGGREHRVDYTSPTYGK